MTPFINLFAGVAYASAVSLGSLAILKIVEIVASKYVVAPSQQSNCNSLLILTPQHVYPDIRCHTVSEFEVRTTADVVSFKHTGLVDGNPITIRLNDKIEIKLLKPGDAIVNVNYEKTLSCLNTNDMFDSATSGVSVIKIF